MASDSQAIPPQAAIRELHQSGGSTVLTIPPMLMEQVGFAEGDKIAIHVDQEGETLLLRKSDDD